MEEIIYDPKGYWRATIRYYFGSFWINSVWAARRLDFGLLKTAPFMFLLL